MIGAPYVFSTPGGRVDADPIAQKVPLKLSRRVFSTNLIILSGHGIDVIPYSLNIQVCHH
jgi:hypothetical protein